MLHPRSVERFYAHLGFHCFAELEKDGNDLKIREGRNSKIQTSELRSFSSAEKRDAALAEVGAALRARGFAPATGSESAIPELKYEISVFRNRGVVVFASRHYRRIPGEIARESEAFRFVRRVVEERAGARAIGQTYLDLVGECALFEDTPAAYDGPSLEQLLKPHGLSPEEFFETPTIDRVGLDLDPQSYWLHSWHVEDGRVLGTAPAFQPRLPISLTAEEIGRILVEELDKFHAQVDKPIRKSKHKGSSQGSLSPRVLAEIERLGGRLGGQEVQKVIDFFELPPEIVQLYSINWPRWDYRTLEDSHRSYWVWDLRFLAPQQLGLRFKGKRSRVPITLAHADGGNWSIAVDLNCKDPSDPIIFKLDHDDPGQQLGSGVPLSLFLGDLHAPA
jgi:hypothetical protein